MILCSECEFVDTGGDPVKLMLVERSRCHDVHYNRIKFVARVFCFCF